jgi:Ca2+-transporting ATPase
LGAGLTWQTCVIGTVIAIMAIGTALWAYDRSWPWQSMLFTDLGLAQLGVALAVRASRVPGKRANWWLPAAVGLSLAGQLGALWLAPLRDLLSTESLNGTQLLVCAITAIIPGILLATFRKLRSRKDS